MAAWRVDFDWSALAAKPARLLAPLVGGLVAALLSLPVMLRQDDPRSNFLLLSDDGLLLRAGSGSRRWPWRDLSNFALRRPDADEAPAAEAKPVLGFTARGDGSRRSGGAGLEAEAVAIEEAYDRPPEEILRELEAWHARALEIEPPAAEDARHDSAAGPRVAAAHRLIRS
jgi:hypothetical protein